MKRIHLDRWAKQIQPPRNPRLHLHQRCPFSNEARREGRCIQQRQQSAQVQWQQRRGYAVAKRHAQAQEAADDEPLDEGEEAIQAAPPPTSGKARRYNDSLQAPSHARATQSGKLSALHARLSLPSKLPLQTLARCLIDPSVDSRPGYNNAPLAILGQDLLGMYTTEYLLCNYPRLPMPVLFAAQYAYNGPATLGAMRSEWGVEVVAAPGQEVDPGLLQLKRVAPGNALSEDGVTRLKDMPTLRRLGTGRTNEDQHYRRGMASRTVYDDEFGDLQTGLSEDLDSQPYPGAPISSNAEASEGEQATSSEASPTTDAVTVEAASASFIRALTGALHLHAGPAASKAFHAAHILSRNLPLHTLFSFTHPTRDLSFLCKREGFEPPVARLISETGRHSRSPVFVVGVFSGDEKLGEGAGSSLNEGRVRAAAAALRSWYLYKPMSDEVVLPSEMEMPAVEGKARRKWKPQMVDFGEIVT